MAYIYSLQERSPKNYKEFEKVDLPRAQRVKAADPTASEFWRGKTNG